MSNPLSDFAPWPQSEDTVTATQLARHYAVWAYGNSARRRTASTAEERDSATASTVHLFVAVKLLKALQAVAPETADEVARDLWCDLWGGAPVDERLFGWLEEFGISPDAVHEVAADLVRDAA